MPITRWCIALGVVAAFMLMGCSTAPDDDADLPLPGFGLEGPTKPRGVYAVIRRADVPLNQSTDDAWAIINEQLVPPVTRGAWRGNGLRLGFLAKDRLDAYSEAMPQPVAFSRTLMNKSDYPVAVLETPRLRDEVRFQIDLTRPPRPRLVETVEGGDNSTLRLLAQIVTEDDGRHSIVLTPQHYIPSPFDLVPRNPLDKDLDGRVYDELTLRLTPSDNQIAVIGLHWPWPMTEVVAADDPSRSDSELLSAALDEAPPPPPNDPAAPPPHFSGSTTNPPNADDAPASLDEDDAPPSDPPVRYERVAPPLATTFGSTLLTGTRIRQPVRTVLLITIEEPEPEASSITDDP